MTRNFLRRLERLEQSRPPRRTPEQKAAFIEAVVERLENYAEGRGRPDDSPDWFGYGTRKLTELYASSGDTWEARAVAEWMGALRETAQASGHWSGEDR